MTGKKRVEMDQEGLGGLAFLHRGGGVSLVFPGFTIPPGWSVRRNNPIYSPNKD